MLMFILIICWELNNSMGIFSDLEPLNDDMATYTGFIKGHEGKKLTAYKPIKTEKYFTIGYGHYGEDVKEGMTITDVQADNYLQQDINKRLPKVKEADITGMVPTSSTSITLLLGDCLATTVMQQRNFSKEKFKVFHPGGNIGSSLLLAKDIMVTGEKMPIIRSEEHTSELQSQSTISYAVFCLKKKKKKTTKSKTNTKYTI